MISIKAMLLRGRAGGRAELFLEADSSGASALSPDRRKTYWRPFLHSGGQKQERQALLRRRGEHPERSFCCVLDHGHGKLRRATQRGRDNLTKRLPGGVLARNLSLLMRHLIGHGTAKQWLACAGPGLIAGLEELIEGLGRLVTSLSSIMKQGSGRIREKAAGPGEGIPVPNRVFFNRLPSCGLS